MNNRAFKAEYLDEDKPKNKYIYILGKKKILQVQHRIKERKLFAH